MPLGWLQAWEMVQRLCAYCLGSDSKTMFLKQEWVPFFNSRWQILSVSLWFVHVMLRKYRTVFYACVLGLCLWVLGWVQGALLGQSSYWWVRQAFLHSIPRRAMKASAGPATLQESVLVDWARNFAICYRWLKMRCTGNLYMHPCHPWRWRGRILVTPLAALRRCVEPRETECSGLSSLVKSNGLL